MTDSVRIALCVITHAEAKPEDFERMLTSAAPHVDGIFIGYTSPPSEAETEEYPKALTEATRRALDGHDRAFSLKLIDDTYHQHDDGGLVLDFGAARNSNFAQVHEWNERFGAERGAFDWIIWLDSDDELIGGEKLNKLLASRKPTTGLVMLKYEYAKSEEGEDIQDQFRERCFRVSANPGWVKLVHENCYVPAGVRLHKHLGAVRVRHHRNVFGPDNKASRERNRRILEVGRKIDPEEPRYHLYLAHEDFAEGQAALNAGDIPAASQRFRDALYGYKGFVEKFAVLPNDDPYMANCRWAECLRLLGFNNESVDRDMQGVKMRPTYPEAYLGVTEGFANTGQWELVKQWAEMTQRNATRDKDSDYVYAVDVQSTQYLPHWFRGMACENLGEWDEAIISYRAAKKVSPHIKDIDAQVAIVRQKKADEVAQNRAREERVGAKGSAGKSICFITRPLFEPWHPITMKTGSGGSERCVIEVAQRFAQMGWRAVVFGTPGADRGLWEDGVEYWDAHQDWDGTEHFDVVVSSRAPEVFDTDIPCDLKILWMHDVNAGPMDDGPWGSRFAKPDVIFGLTNWHCQHLSRLYGVPLEKFQVVANGFDPTEFTYTPQKDKDPLSFVFASSPDRGVDTLLEMWPYIRRDFPGATLQTFYGWTGINKILERHPTHPIGGFKQGVERLLEKVNEGDITWNDRVPRQTLAAAYSKASIWAYPTEFLETYCITALEMQVSGVMPVVSNLGALKEVVPLAGLRLDGMPKNDDYRRRFMRKLHEVIDVPVEQREVTAGSNYSFAAAKTWDAAFDRWLEIVTPAEVYA